MLYTSAKSRDLLGKEVQGAKLPAGARGVPALSLFPKRLGDDALARCFYAFLVVSGGRNP
jgi:hypothetical protein